MSAWAWVLDRYEIERYVFIVDGCDVHLAHQDATGNVKVTSGAQKTADGALTAAGVFTNGRAEREFWVRYRDPWQIVNPAHFTDGKVNVSAVLAGLREDGVLL